MLVEDFFVWAKEEFDTEMTLMRDKGKEYTVSDADKLKNFKSIGERMKCKPEFVAMVYLLKHMDSVRNYVLDGIEASNESIEGRLRDIRNYCLLVGALIKESKEQNNDEWVKGYDDGFYNIHYVWDKKTQRYNYCYANRCIDW